MLATLRRVAPFLALATLLASATACTAASPVRPAGQVSSLAERSVKPVAGPAGFQPAAASFWSADSGAVLGGTGCRPRHSCQLRLAVTSSGGARWRFLKLPGARLPFPGWVARAGRILFASRQLGWWLAGQKLRYTRDGGEHWRSLSLGGSVDAMAVSAGIAYAVISLPVGGRPAELFRSPAGRAAWARVGHLTAAVAMSSLAVSGRAVWFGGGNHVWATADGESWHRYSFRCRGPRYQLSGIAAASASRVSFLCINLVSPSMGTEGIEVMDSANGGRTAHFAGRRWIASNGGTIAVPRHRARVITFATSAGFPNWLGRSADGGKTWKRVASSTRSADWNSLSYVNRKAGWVMLGGSYLLRTSDAGLTWHRVSF